MRRDKAPKIDAHAGVGAGGAKIQVIQQTGRPIGLLESMSRNLLRFIDWLPSLYIAGCISIFVTERQQRLGDLVANTLVVHRGRTEASHEAGTHSRTFTASLSEVAQPQTVVRHSSLAADTVAQLSPADLQAIESFLARRLDLPLATRDALAQKLVTAIVAKIQSAIPPTMSAETHFSSKWLTRCVKFFTSESRCVRELALR